LGYCEWLSQLDYDVMEQRLEQTDLVLGSSDYITEKACERFPHHVDKCQTVYNGVDDDLFIATTTRRRRSVNLNNACSSSAECRPKKAFTT